MYFQKLKLWLKSYLKDLLKEEYVLKFKKLDEAAKEPTKAYIGDAGFDLYALERMYIPLYEWRVIRTGLAFEIPEGWHLQVHTRSSYGKMGVRCHLGIIDSGYRNELMIIVHNGGREDFIVEKGSKFCQVVMLPVPIVHLQEVQTLSDSERGQGGFGSSGK